MQNRIPFIIDHVIKNPINTKTGYNTIYYDIEFCDKMMLKQQQYRTFVSIAHYLNGRLQDWKDEGTVNQILIGTIVSAGLLLHVPLNKLIHEKIFHRGGDNSHIWLSIILVVLLALLVLVILNKNEYTYTNKQDVAVLQVSYF